MSPHRAAGLRIDLRRLARHPHPLLTDDDGQYEDHGSDGDPLVIAAETTARSPHFKMTVNVTLAVRKALRRFLGIEPAVPASEMEKAHDV
jgi:hypothetical protein